MKEIEMLGGPHDGEKTTVEDDVTGLIHIGPDFKVRFLPLNEKNQLIWVELPVSIPGITDEEDPSCFLCGATQIDVVGFEMKLTWVPAANAWYCPECL